MLSATANALSKADKPDFALGPDQRVCVLVFVLLFLCARVYVCCLCALLLELLFAKDGMNAIELMNAGFVSSDYFALWPSRNGENDTCTCSCQVLNCSIVLCVYILR
jgi:hypothetical protein